MYLMCLLVDVHVDGVVWCGVRLCELCVFFFEGSVDTEIYAVLFRRRGQW